MSIGNAQEPLIIIPVLLLERLAQARSDHLPVETGGFLLGRRRGCHLEITEATLQADGDVATTNSFARYSPRHAMQVETTWEASAGHIGLVGDWHSHPDGLGEASGKDRKAWKELVGAVRAPCIGIIVVEHGHRVLHLSARRILAPKVTELQLLEMTDEDVVYGAV